jgi:transcriptional regulator of NAD metabolism
LIPLKDKKLNILDINRIYLIDKINAYFKEVTEYKTNPTKTKKELINSFNDKINKGLNIFK